jgi:hypothetical protein
MEYLLLINVDETHAPGEPGSDGFQENMAAWMAFNQRLVEGGHWIAGASLQPASTATVLDRRSGAVTDGPYAETKEQLAGFYLLSAADLDEALELAGAMPLPDAAVEVRPVLFRPDA